MDWNKIVENLGATIVNVFWIVVVVAVISNIVPLMVGENTYIRDAWDDLWSLTYDCDDNYKELQIDIRCIANPTCTMTRDDMAEFEERQDKFNKYCPDH